MNIPVTKEMVHLFSSSDLNVSFFGMLHCRLVLAGQMELFWLFWRSLDGLKTEQYIANDLGVCIYIDLLLIASLAHFPCSKLASR
jgi:hypothetical protein